MKITVIVKQKDRAARTSIEDRVKGIGIYDSIQSQVDLLMEKKTDLDKAELISHAIIHQTHKTTWDGMIKVMSGHDQAMVLRLEQDTIITIVIE